jgi:transcriptional regulator
MRASNLDTKTCSSDLEQDNRRAKVLVLHSKGLIQSEIAQELNVDQSTVSRDLNSIREESRKQIENAVKNTPFVYIRYLAGLDQITKRLWEIADSNPNNDHNININSKDRIAVLTLLIQCNNLRLKAFVGGPDTNAMEHIRYMKELERLSP